MTYEASLFASLVASEWLQQKADAEERERTWREKARWLYDRGHPWQREVYDDKGRRLVLLTGGRCGKTTGMGDDILQTMLTVPGARCLFIALTRDSAIDLLWDPLKETLEQLDIRRHAKLQEVSLRLRLANGAQLQLVGADDKKQIEKLRGIPRHKVWIDEAGSFDEQLLEFLIERVLGPRLGDYKGTLGIGGTPPPGLRGIFYEASRSGGNNRHWKDRDDPAFEGWIGWSLHTWNALDAAPYAPRIQSAWEEALETKKRNGWTDSHPVWMREYLGLWAADDTDTVFKYRSHLDDGTAWNEWDPEKDPATGVAHLPTTWGQGWRYVFGIDLGSSDPTAIEGFAWHPSDDSKTLHHCYEFISRDVYARALAELLIGKELKHESPGGVFGVTGWPEATSVDTAALGGATLRELAEVYGIKLEKAEIQGKEKFGGIELVNGDLTEGRIKVMKGSELQKQFVQNQWDRDDFGQRKRHKGQRDDAADAAVCARLRAQHLLSEEAPAPPQKRLSDFHRVGMERVPEERGEFDHLFEEDPVWG